MVIVKQHTSFQASCEVAGVLSCLACFEHRWHLLQIGDVSQCLNESLILGRAVKPLITLQIPYVQCSD